MCVGALHSRFNRDQRRQLQQQVLFVVRICPIQFCLPCSSQAYRQKHDDSLASRMVGTAYAKKSGRGRGKALTKPWSRPKTTPTQSRLMRTKSPHFIESTCSDPARKSKTSKAVAEIDLALERGMCVPVLQRTPNVYIACFVLASR